MALTLCLPYLCCSICFAFLACLLLENSKALNIFCSGVENFIYFLPNMLFYLLSTLVNLTGKLKFWQICPVHKHVSLDHDTHLCLLRVMVDYAGYMYMYVIMDPDINILKCTVFIRILVTPFLVMAV